MFGSTQMPIWWLDRDLRLAGANDAYARLVGRSTVSSAVHEDVQIAPGARALAAEARATERAVTGEATATVDGRPQTLRTVVFPLQSGAIVGLAFEEARTRSDAFSSLANTSELKEALDFLTIALALFIPDGQLSLCNTAFAKMFSLDAEWLKKQPEFGILLDAMRAVGRLPEERDFTQWRAERRAWICSDKRRVDEPWLLPSGEILRVSFLPLSDGSTLLAVENQTREVNLLADRDQLLAVQAVILDHLEEGIAVFGPDGKLKLFNKRFADIVIASPETLSAAPQADKLMNHLAGLLNEPERAQGLRALILGATAGREANSGRIKSTLGFTIDYSGVPLPNGDALIIIKAIDPIES